MRVLVLTTDLSTGGAEMALFRVLNTLTAQGIEPLVVSMMGIHGKHFPTMGLPIYSLEMPRAMLTWRGIMKLRAIVREFKPDIIQGWMYHANVVAHLARFFCVSPKPPLALAVRASLTRFAEDRPLTKMVIRADAVLSRFADRVFYVSRLGHQQHVDFGYCAHNAVVIPNGFNCQVFKPDLAARDWLRAQLGLPQDALCVGLIASAQPVKNHAGFFQAVAEITDEFPHAHFLCVGRRVTEENAELKAAIPDKARACVHLLGERGDIPRLTAGLDLAMSTSHAEAFPNVVGEAMACGIPLVVTDVGDSAWILDGCGVVVPPDDVHLLADGMRTMLSCTAVERAALGERARQRIREVFSLDSVAASYLREWQRLLSSELKE